MKQKGIQVKSRKYLRKDEKNWLNWESESHHTKCNPQASPKKAAEINTRNRNLVEDSII